MLIVGGTAALTAIAAYLAWHFFRKFRSYLRERKRAARMSARAEAVEHRIDVHEPTH
jgi:peptidoglycan/LPS O-acetylase OafA/YrhL